MEAPFDVCSHVIPKSCPSPASWAWPEPDSLTGSASGFVNRRWHRARSANMQLWKPRQPSARIRYHRHGAPLGDWESVCPGLRVWQRASPREITNILGKKIPRKSSRSSMISGTRFKTANALQQCSTFKTETVRGSDMYYTDNRIRWRQYPARDHPWATHRLTSTLSRAPSSGARPGGRCPPVALWPPRGWWRRPAPSAACRHADGGRAWGELHCRDDYRHGGH